ncbi:hypothetical protein GCM10023310_70790 [Paenibacillus vulneris]|uniref:Uncharacterized protein n=1 Tax=Paenibacillus vulneris TaxID=1133364 RepID=A0ABW3UGE6_9BACL
MDKEQKRNFYSRLINGNQVNFVDWEQVYTVESYMNCLNDTRKLRLVSDEKGILLMEMPLPLWRYLENGGNELSYNAYLQESEQMRKNYVNCSVTQ